MSTNEANIKITVDDSDLVTTDNRLERVEDGLQGVAREGRQANTSLQGVGRAAMGAVGGLVSMELAKRALTGAINGLRASIQAFADTNEEGQRTVDAVTASLNSMKAALGQAIIGGDNAEEVVASLERTFGRLEQVIVDNEDAIASLTINGLDALDATIASTISLIEDLNTVAEGLESTFGSLEGAAHRASFGMRTLRDGLRLAAGAFDDGSDAIDKHSDDLDKIASSASGATRSILGFGVALVSSLDFDLLEEAQQRAQNVFDAFSNVGNGGVGGGGGRDDEGSNPQQLLIQRREFNNNMSSLFAELEAQRQASKNLTAQNQLDQQAKEIDAKKQFLLQMATMEDEAAAARLAAQQQQAEELKALRDKQTAVATSAASSLQNALLAITDKTGKERKNALKKALGQELIQRGGALVAQGIGNAIALNPKGAFEIAGGASMVAAGAKLSGGGGGGRGGSPTSNTTPPAATNNVTNVTYNQSTQFGFVGDRRAAIKELEQINQGSQDRGL